MLRIVFTEGSVDLPAGYEDRSTNLLVPANTQTQPNLSVARDWMKPDETLAAYVDRQLALLKSQLAGHRVLNRQAVRLGAAPATDEPADPSAAACVGERIDAHYRNGKLVIYQRQAAFEIAPSRVLVFSASQANGFGDAFERLWTDWLASYQAPPPEPAPETSDLAPNLESDAASAATPQQDPQ